MFNDISFIKKTVKEAGFSEMYISFEKAANILYIHIPVKAFTLDISKKFSIIERTLVSKLNNIGVEVLPLFKSEFVGTNMKYYKVKEG